MGGCLEKMSPDDKEAAKKNRAIDNFLKNERKGEEDDVRLLLLGTGGSGKSTIAKQMKIIHLQGFPEKEKHGFKNVIYHNVLRAANTLVVEAKNRNMSFDDNSSIELIFNTPLTGKLTYTKELANAVESIWKEQSIRDVYAKSHEFQLDDSANYFLDNCQKFAKDDYLPEESDILRARAKTTGIVEIHFMINKNNYTLIDVGGQRNERKKWLHCFQEVNSIIFCVALNEYDLLLEEDNFTNRMHESLKVFESVLASPYFLQMPIILFLNKRDLFAEKIKRVDLSCCFPRYDGGLDEQKASHYIKKKFEGNKVVGNRKIFTHFTTATDTANVRFVFNDVENIIINSLVSDSGLTF